jgi:hypothetical protein
MASAMHAELFVGTKYEYLGWATPAGSGGLGLNFISLSTPGILTSDGNSTNASMNVIYLGYGRDVNGWKLGVTAKYFQENLPGSSGNAWGVDLGLQKRLNDNFQVAMVVQDLVGSKIRWNSGYEETVPANYRLGLNYQRENWLLAMEVEKTTDFTMSHFGMEYAVNSFLKLRAGLRGSDVTAGVGLGKDNFLFDYAYCAGDLGNTHRFSLLVKFSPAVTQ